MKHSSSNGFYTFYISLIVALGGFLMGFDASVISGVVKFIEPEFALTKLQLGWAVASLSLTATLAMMTSGPISQRFGRRPVLMCAAFLFFVSALLSAIASSFTLLVLARMLGGLGVGAALIIAPMYIAEIAPAAIRGRLVSLNQLNIVLGISAAFFSNYLILQLAESPAEWLNGLNIQQWQWRYMLGIEALPALLYLLFLFWVPESPRWLVMKGRKKEAMAVMTRTLGQTEASQAMIAIETDLNASSNQAKASVGELFSPKLRLVLLLGISIAVLQQITGINAVFFYAPMIFELSGLGTNAAFMQAIFVGLINIVFTLVAIALIDKVGRKTLLTAGVAGIVVCMFSLSHGFANASYTLTQSVLDSAELSQHRDALTLILNQTFTSELDFKQAIQTTLGPAAAAVESQLVAAAITINQTQILLCILGFVACFAVSLGPVMWVLFSELFPNHIRALAISFVGLINSGVSFGVQFIFPWELSVLGSTLTFMIYGIFAALGLIIIVRYLPETKGKTLEQLATDLASK